MKNFFKKIWKMICRFFKILGIGFMSLGEGLSTFNLFPPPPPRSKYYDKHFKVKRRSTKDLSDDEYMLKMWEEDAKALQKDWEMVGKDFRKAIDEVKKEHGID